VKHEIAVIAYNTDIFILSFLNKLLQYLFFGIDIIKKSHYPQDSSLRVMRGSYKIEEN
jgi:hypothetical protein